MRCQIRLSTSALAETPSSYLIGYWPLSYLGFSERKLIPEERAWLEKKCPYFKKTYLDYLAKFQFRPSEQVTITFIPNSETNQEYGQIEIEVHGLWKETILYEVPLMAALSEAYFHTVDTDWSLDGQEGAATSRISPISFVLSHGV